MKVNVPVREEATNHLIFNSLVKYESIMIPDKMTKNATPASPLFPFGKWTGDDGTQAIFNRL